jgi:hypothetical protein
VNAGLYKNIDLQASLPSTIRNQYLLKTVEPRP